MSLRAVRGAVSRLLAAGLLSCAALTTVAAVAPSAARADSTYTMESQFISKMNAARESAGMRPYSVASDLTSIARQHSADMAQRQSLYHNPNLTSQVQNWQAVGENVGEGPTVSDIHDAFMRSPEHRANILDHDFTQVGVGVSVDNNGIVWVTEDFREPMQSTSSTSRPATHHKTTSTATRPVTQTTTRPAAHVSTRPTPAHTAPAKQRVARPTASASPQAQLLARLAAASAAPNAASADPVTQAFDYLSTVTSLTTTSS